MIAQLFLDIETIPAQRPDVLEEIRATEKAALDAAVAAVKAPANYGQEAAIKWYAEKGDAQIAALVAAYDTAVEAAYRKTGLDGSYGQIACVSFAYLDGEPINIWHKDCLAPDGERRLLDALDEMLVRTIPLRMAAVSQVVGHNVSSFDLRFIVQRCIVNGIRPHPAILRAAQAKPWETDRVFDTMVQWAGVGGKIKLDKLCKALGLPGKGDMDGSKVWDYVKAGRIAEVADYCADDVRKVRQVWERMTFAKTTIDQFEDVPA